MQQKLKRTKIVCTMGPACDNDETICEMLKAGMNVARFNFSHGSYEEHQGRIERVRRCAAKVGKPVGILLDTKGPEVRTGLLEGHAKVEVHAGDKITVTAQPTSEDWLGNASHISLDYEKLPSEAEKGSIILIDDGLVGLEVESVDGQDMHCVVLNNGLIGERKGVNIPNVDISLPAVTERDRQDILFGLTQNIDYIAASFIRNGKAVEDIRQLCRENGGEHVTIFPKIECAIETEKHMAVHAELAMPEGASGTRVVNNVVGMSAVQMATAVGAKCITVPTTTGRTARLISHFRPNMPILAFSRHEWAVQQMIMYWGVIPRQAEITQGTVNGTIVKAVETAKELGFVEKGDLTVATAGDARLSVQLEGKVSSTNLAYVAQVR